MIAEDLIVRLDGVRATGTDRWIARCPAHDDRHPSLSVYEPGDGHILIHCFAGCPPDVVVSAVGLILADLMPPRPRDTPNGPGGLPGLRHPWWAEDLRGALRHEALLLTLLIERVQRAEDYLLEDLDRAVLASQRLLDALGGPP